MTTADDINLSHRASLGETEAVKVLLRAGADVHAVDDDALRMAALHGETETVKVLLAYGANVHAKNDNALCTAAWHGHPETVRTLAKHIFTHKSWHGKSRAEIEAGASALYEKIKAENLMGPILPGRLHTAATILVECALTCWEQVRPAPPKLNISLLPVQPRPL